MENAVEALEMAFAMFIFIIALTFALFIFGRVKAASDQISYINDNSKFMNYVAEQTAGETLATSGVTRMARVVQTKDLIAILYNFSTGTQSITIDLIPNSLNNDKAYNLSRDYETGRFVFGNENFGAFKETKDGTTIEYYYYAFGSPADSNGHITIKEYIEAFIEGGITKRGENGLAERRYLGNIIDGKLVEVVR